MNKNSANFETDKDPVFARIAQRYDFMCDLFSMYAHRLWKQKMAKMVAHNAPKGASVLDVASGTGDIALRLAKRRPDLSITASDICSQMLDVAKGKAARKKIPMDFKIFDAHDLSAVPNNSADIYAMSLGMKICDRDKALSEAYRVLRPGGLFLCLEASHIPVPMVNYAYVSYMEFIIPIIGRLVSGGDESTYNYLLKGIHNMPNQKDFCKEIESFGFDGVTHQNLSFGIVAIHKGVKPL